MAEYIDWPGLTGRPYRYWFLTDPRPIGIVDKPGNYMFVRPTPTGWVPVYIGQTDNLRNRLPTHERWADAVAAGATKIMGHSMEGGEAVRCAEEKDLIQRWNPPCNTQHVDPLVAALLGRRSGS